MHIPDGFLSAKTFSVFYGISIVAVGIALKNLKNNIEEKQVPLFGVVSAFIFAAQMLNFPVAGGTSGHFMGGVLAAILLGPFSGLVIMTTVLIIQCLVFQDGGITALGANVFNMGIIGAIGGYYIYNLLIKIFGRIASVFIASWTSIIFASAFCAFQLSISGIVPFKVSLIAMASVHALIGIGEGIITVMVIGFLTKIRLDLLELKKI